VEENLILIESISILKYVKEIIIISILKMIVLKILKSNQLKQQKNNII